jgi:serine/threonine-protein kinase ULK/ATG1
MNELKVLDSTNLSVEIFIAKGGYGKVYKIYNHLDQTQYALKKILITENSIKYALQEIRILSKLSHPHIIRYYTSWIEKVDPSTITENDVNDEDQIIQYKENIYNLCIQLEYCKETLSSYIENRRYNDYGLEFKYVTEIVQGLKYLHNSNIIHRDLKPDNILIHQNQIKITDFGFVKSVHTKHESNTCYLGTFLYASPEQYSHLHYSFETDIYSLGIIMFVLFSLFKTESELYFQLLYYKKYQQFRNYVLFQSIIKKMISVSHLRPTIYEIETELIKKSHITICNYLLSEIISKI